MYSVKLNPQDNVAIAKTDLPKGLLLSELQGLEAKQPIPAMHKFAVAPIKKGEAILKYGQPIGIASLDIAAGEHIHVHNCEMGTFTKNYDFGKRGHLADLLPPHQRATFQGYKRADGHCGTRNYIGILTSVNCSATVANLIADSCRQQLGASPVGLDGIVPIVHSGGCGMQNGGEGFDLLSRVLKGYATHPNFGGLLLVGLGCEVFQLSTFIEASGFTLGKSFQYLNIQDTGGTAATVDKGVELIRDMIPQVARIERTTCPASELTIALQCGGSDGLSGITANPALGAAVDILVKHGGSAILAETPEIYGAEHLLTQRSASPKIGKQLIERLEWWDNYTAAAGEQLNNNPSPGNKAGGLTTILEKSLGAQAKSGSTALRGVYKYAEPIASKGLVFMDSPGYDPVSVTGQVAAGANVVCFTTGRGSAFGCKPSPSIKLATNTPMFQRLEDDMDINCGKIFDGEKSVQEMGLEIFNHVITVASGEATKSEALGYGHTEFNPWHIGCVY